ncbi:MAG: M48 family metalloprotease [Halanaerobiales bacterium]|nr:M48 family metalloprotease [Halanaerobiales bacterium]
MDEDKLDIKRLFNQKRRKKAAEYNNKKTKITIINNLIKISLVFLFFYNRYEVKLFNLIPENYLTFIKLFIYLIIIFLSYFIINTLIKYFTTYKLNLRFNLSKQNVKEWILDKIKAFLLSFVFVYLLSYLFLYLYNQFVNYWWLIFTVILSLFIILLNYLLPIVILPLFYTLKSYPESELKDKLMSKFKKLDIVIEDIYEINLSSKISSANAAVMGMGKTRKIVLSDNLVGRFSDQEIEAILCHEIGHHVNNDIYKNLILSPLLIALTTYIAYISLPNIVSILEYQSFNIITVIPILLILWSLIYGIFTPLQLYLSRKYEKNADIYAFEVIDDPSALAKAFAKLADGSLSRLEYKWWEKLFKASHPSIKSRIINAKKYNKQNKA